MEIDVAQPVGGDAIERWCRDDAAEGRRCSEADIIGHDQEDIRRILWRHHTRWPCAALRLISPRNGCGGGGSWLPGIVVVALGEPGIPVVSCALAVEVSAVAARRARVIANGFVFMAFLPTHVAIY